VKAEDIQLASSVDSIDKRLQTFFVTLLERLETSVLSMTEVVSISALNDL